MFDKLVNDMTIKTGFNSNKRIIDSIKNRQKNKNDDDKVNQKFDSVLRQNSNITVKPDKKIDKKLLKACIEMESIFVAKMLKEMRKTVHKSDFLHGGNAEEIFEDMLYDKYSLKLSKNSNLGLAKMLYNEMSMKNKPGSFSANG